MWFKKPSEDALIRRKPVRSGMTVLVIPDLGGGQSRRFSLRWGWLLGLGVLGLCIGIGAFGAPVLLAGSVQTNIALLGNKLQLEAEKADLERRLSAQQADFERQLNLEQGKVSALTDQARRLGARLQTLEAQVQAVSDRAGVKVTRTSTTPRGGSPVLENDPFRMLGALEAQLGEVDGAFGDALKPLAGRLREEAAIPSGFPTTGRITSKFGSRFGPSGRFERHTGWDIATAIGTPVSVTAPGIVETAGWTNVGYGLHIVVNHGYGFKTLYGHLSRILVAAGQRVTAGQRIGLVGSTGYSSGPHLHYEVRVGGTPISPGPYLFRARPQGGDLEEILQANRTPSEPQTR
jgi:murein DD-endopeptidase MepM/ murein hydrolase activator NlpD